MNITGFTNMMVQLQLMSLLNMHVDAFEKQINKMVGITPEQKKSLLSMTVEEQRIRAERRQLLSEVLALDIHERSHANMLAEYTSSNKPKKRKKSKKSKK